MFSPDVHSVHINRCTRFFVHCFPDTSAALRNNQNAERTLLDNSIKHTATSGYVSKLRATNYTYPPVLSRIKLIKKSPTLLYSVHNLGKWNFKALYHMMTHYLYIIIIWNANVTRRNTVATFWKRTNYTERVCGLNCRQWAVFTVVWTTERPVEVRLVHNEVPRTKEAAVTLSEVNMPGGTEKIHARPQSIQSTSPVTSQERFISYCHVKALLLVTCKLL